MVISTLLHQGHDSNTLRYGIIHLQTVTGKVSALFSLFIPKCHLVKIIIKFNQAILFTSEAYKLITSH